MVDDASSIVLPFARRNIQYHPLSVTQHLAESTVLDAPLALRLRDTLLGTAATAADWSRARLEAAALQEHGAELGVKFVLLRRRLTAAGDTPYRLLSLVHQLQPIPPQTVHLDV